MTSMHRRLGGRGSAALLGALVAALLPLAGCGALAGLLGPSQTSVSLVNSTNDPIEIKLFYHDDQNVLTQDLLKTFGEERDFTIQAGQTQTFSIDCDQLQSIFIDDAKLNVLSLPVGPSTDTEIYRDGSDFNCGDTLTFTFTAPPIPTELNVSFGAS